MSASPPDPGAPAPAAPASGTGSVWNPKSWHWETRDYRSFGAEALRQSLLTLRAVAGPLAVRVSAVPSLALEASVVIRRGRKYVVWELSSLSVSWVGFAPSRAVDRETAGTLALGPGGVSNEEVESDFALRMSHSGTTAFDTACRDIAAGALVPLVRRTLRAWSAALKRHDDELEAQAIAHRDAAAASPEGVAAQAAMQAASRAAAPVLLSQAGAQSGSSGAEAASAAGEGTAAAAADAAAGLPARVEAMSCSVVVGSGGGVAGDSAAASGGTASRSSGESGDLLFEGSGVSFVIFFFIVIRDSSRARGGNQSGDSAFPRGGWLPLCLFVVGRRREGDCGFLRPGS